MRTRLTKLATRAARRPSRGLLRDATEILRCLGRVKTPVSGNGDCAFNATLENMLGEGQRDRQGRIQYPRSVVKGLRERTVRAMRANREFFMKCEGFSEAEFNREVAIVSTPEMMIFVSTLKAVSLAIGRRICVVIHDEGTGVHDQSYPKDCVLEFLPDTSERCHVYDDKDRWTMESASYNTWRANDYFEEVYDVMSPVEQEELVVLVYDGRIHFECGVPVNAEAPAAVEHIVVRRASKRKTRGARRHDLKNACNKTDFSRYFFFRRRRRYSQQCFCEEADSAPWDGRRRA
jgi:hypothetical protein